MNWEDLDQETKERHIEHAKYFFRDCYYHEGKTQRYIPDWDNFLVDAMKEILEHYKLIK